VYFYTFFQARCKNAGKKYSKKLLSSIENLFRTWKVSNVPMGPCVIVFLELQGLLVDTDKPACPQDCTQPIENAERFSMSQQQRLLLKWLLCSLLKLTAPYLSPRGGAAP